MVTQSLETGVGDKGQVAVDRYEVSLAEVRHRNILYFFLEANQKTALTRMSAGEFIKRRCEETC